MGGDKRSVDRTPRSDDGYSALGCGANSIRVVLPDPPQSPEITGWHPSSEPGNCFTPPPGTQPERRAPRRMAEQRSAASRSRRRGG